MVVAIDPETGALGMPSPEQSRALVSPGSATLSRLPEGVVEIRGAAGAAGLDLQGRFQDYAVVRMGPDGKCSYGCIHADGCLEPTLRDTLPAPGRLEEE